MIPIMSAPEGHFFEGAEKLLEIWFDSSKLPSSGSLRRIPTGELESLVNLANANIVSVMKTSKVDAYVLSESSLFVSDRRVLIKTCGTTSLLTTVEPLLHLAQTYAGLDKVSVCNYSRRNFLKPELQPSFHQTFDEEIALLDNIFPGGAGYCMGKLNRDRWYLYNYAPVDSTINVDSDQTIEIMMSDLDPDVMSIFTNLVASSALEARKLSGIDKLMPTGTLIDDKLFEPCGYSMNAVFPNKDEYYTIHITPELKFSYVSFESNAILTNYADLAQRVVATFKPGSFLVTLYASGKSKEGRDGQRDLWTKVLKGYTKSDLQLLALADGTVFYAHYSKK